MLRSFQYVEKSYMEYSVQNDLLHDKEIDIANKFVTEHPVCRDTDRRCPVCNGAIGKYFYTKWGVDYLRCDACKSVYAVYDKKTVEQYQASDDLRQLRLSDEYQEQAALNRREVWDNFLEWLEVRAFRFMKRNRELSIVDMGNRLKGYSQVITDSVITGVYDLREAPDGNNTYHIPAGGADLVLYLDQLKGELNPEKRLREFSGMLKEDGLLVVNARVGSGFDILTLRESNREIYPYEHILLPSVRGLTQLLRQNGYEVLEVTTPGVMDLKYVMESKEKLGDRETFVRYFLEEASPSMLQEFQRFLQKGCLSSFICIIARKGKGHEDL